MGLDIVELVMETEETFAISIPDRDAERLRTVGELQDYVVTAVAAAHPHRPPGSPRHCASGTTFYRARRALVEMFALPRAGVTPDTHFAGLLPPGDPRANWNRFADSLAPLRLPRAGRGWFGGEVIPRECTTLRDFVRTAIAGNYGTFVVAAGDWTEADLREKVLDVIELELGVDRARLTRDASFVRDLGAD